jgi:hypothetical protein
MVTGSSTTLLYEAHLVFQFSQTRSTSPLLPFWSKPGSGSTAEAGGGFSIATCLVGAQAASAATTASAMTGRTRPCPTVLTSQRS